MVSTQNRSLQRSGTPPPSGLQPSMTDVQSLVRVQHIEGDRTPREWISLLATVDKVDEEEQAARKKLGRNSLLLLLGGIVSLALVPVAPFIGVPLGAALLGGAVLQSRSYFFHKRLCLGRDLSRLFSPFWPSCGRR